MASTRQGLIDYCLRELGHPVVEINVDDDQVSDRIDEALQFYQDYHYDAVERIYLSTKVTASRITLTSSVASNFSNGETITGQTSGAKAQIVTEGLETSSTGTSLTVAYIVGTFSSSEVIVGSGSNQSATTTAITLGVIDKKYIETTDGVTGVVRVLPFSAINTGESYMWDIRYQLRLNDMFDLLSTSIIYYQQVKSHLALIDQLLVGSKSFRFQRHQNRLFLDMSWETDVSPGEYIIVEAYRILDPNDWTDVYNDRFLKRYATALIKRQWGANLKKFEGIQMPGGVTLNGQKIYDEAVEEIRYLETEAQTTYVEPPNFMVG
jgi:hypothetical protein